MAGVFGNGATLEVDFASTTATATPTYTAIAEIYDLGRSGLTTDALDATAHGDATREFVAGLKDDGEISVGYRLNPGEATQTDLETNRGKVFLARLTFPASGSAVTQQREIVADVIITSIDESLPHDDLLDGSMTLKVSGAVQITDEA